MSAAASTGRIVVLGGGITGLASAYYVRELAAAHGWPLHLTVVERERRPGGCVETRREHGLTMEMGAESIPPGKAAALELADRLGLAEDAVTADRQRSGTLILRDGRLRLIPSDFTLFSPSSLRSLTASGLLSLPGMLRAAMEPLVPQRFLEGDESLAAFVTRRFGREVLERLAQPLVAGIYSADPERLSMNAALPRFVCMERKHGSVLRALHAMARAKHGRDGAGNARPGMLSLRGGLGVLTQALAQRLGDALRLGCEAVSARRVQGAGGTTHWLISLSDGEALRADALIVALPAHAAARVLEAEDAPLATLLRSIHYHSIAAVTLAYDARAIPALPRGHGLVVPYGEHRWITAVTFATQKFPGRAPDGCVLLRAYVGGALQGQLLELDDAAIYRLVRSDLHHILRIGAEPKIAALRRWVNALPEYAVGHLARVDEIGRRTSHLPHLALAGAAYRGVGVADCIADGKAVAERILPALFSEPQSVVRWTTTPLAPA